ncbi:hypothetical protein NliqN6_3754 [Naganishia liquefaciens]|uniref:Signal recognition particle protein n=1 Tax=Naganishia liquefaciens TaxID=104408 RepID=A0A8H3TUE3_9TREE|nr:hypothetical protein NliqN6_3754 [Naganishia liquefaciens]
MPSIEEVFDDDTDLPLPAAPTRGASSNNYLRNTGTQGALLEEISDQDVDAMADAAGNYDMDMDRVAEQGRGFGDNVGRPVTTSSASHSAANIGSTPLTDLRPTGDRAGQQGPMGGIMGDFMKMQQAEEERMKRLEKQLGAGMIVKDQQEYKSWYSLYPLYFDAKLSVNQGRRVPRSQALWWPQSLHIAKACSSLGLQCVHEIEKTHPADWRNPGRVKVLIKKDNQYAHPVIQNRSQLSAHIARQMQRMNPNLVPKSDDLGSRREETAKEDTGLRQAANGDSAKSFNQAPSSRPRRKTRNLPLSAPHPFPPMDDRLPINSPAVALGIAVQSVRRDLEQEKERKRVGSGQNTDVGNAPGGNEPPSGSNKPKMKKIVVRKR